MGTGVMTAAVGLGTNRSPERIRNKEHLLKITDDMIEMVRYELQVPDIVPDEKVCQIIYRILGETGSDHD